MTNRFAQLRSKIPVAVNPSGTVRVNHRLALVDTHKTSFVPRHTPDNTLRQLALVSEMLEEYGERVVVSPDGSACSSTSVYVESTYADIHARMRSKFNEDIKARLEEIEQKIEQKIERKIERKIEQMVREYIENQTAFVRHILQAHAIRNIQDWRVLSMKRLLRLPKTDASTFREVVSAFLRRFDVTGLYPADLQSIISSTDRDNSNAVFHIDVNNVDDQLMRQMFSCIKTSNMSPEDISRYERLADFGRGKSSVSPKNLF